MKIYGRELNTLTFKEPKTDYWVIFNHFLSMDDRLAFNFLVKGQKNNNGRRFLDDTFGSRERGADVFDAFYAPGRENRVGLPVGSCAFARCAVHADKIVYQLSSKSPLETIYFKVDEWR